MNGLQARGIDVGYDGSIVVHELSISIPVDRITVIVGANGSGKSTLLMALSRILQPLAGEVLVDNEPVQSIRTRDLARRLSILPQRATAPESLSVGELVSYGRYPHKRWLNGQSQEDAQMVRWAMEVTGVEQFVDRPIGSLSGGQQQRAWIAMTLAQGATLLLLDEPTGSLDTCHQLEVMELLARLNRQESKTVIMVLHDLNLAARYADHMVALKEGRIVAEGPPEEVMVEETIMTAFNVHSHISKDPRTGAPMCFAYLPQ